MTTDHDDGFVIEGGADSFVAGKGSVLALAHDTRHRGASRFQSSQAPRVLCLVGRGSASPPRWPSPYRAVTNSLLLGSPLLSWAGQARAMADLVLPRSDGAEDESTASFVTRRLGREMLDRIAEPLIAGIHAAEPDTMSLHASFPRLLDMEREHRSLILAARAAASRPAPAHGLSHFASFAGEWVSWSRPSPRIREGWKPGPGSGQSASRSAAPGDIG